MPGRGSYGPAGKWVYERAKKIRSKNPDMEESTSFAIATQQAHKLGKSPKKFRTAEGVRAAKAKYSLPRGEYQKTAGAEELIAKREAGEGTAADEKQIRYLRDQLGEGGAIKTASPSFVKIAGFVDELAKIVGGSPGAKFMIGALLNSLAYGLGEKATTDEVEKNSAMGMDLRLKDPAGVRRPPFPTEGSVELASKRLNKSMRTGQLGTSQASHSPNPRAVTTL